MSELAALPGRLLTQVELALPLFVLVALGYLLIRVRRWPIDVSEALSRFVFAVAIPAFLFRLMADRSALPTVDARLLIAFFGGALVVFVLGRLIAAFVFRLDGVSGSVFALGGIFSNNVLLGLPLAEAALGTEALPSVALVLVFNALTLWTLVTVSVEWARHGSLTWAGFAKTVRGVVTNPVVAAILLGAAYGLTGLPIPGTVDAPLSLLSEAATPLALVALGMSLAQYGLRQGWRLSLAMAVVKLAVMPLVVWVLALLLGLPQLETQVVVLLASTASGVNVYLMARRFEVLEGAVAGTLVTSTAAAAVTTPLVLTLLGG